MKWAKRIFKEPLLHFLVLSAGLFAANCLWSEGTEVEQPDTIVVTEQRIKSLILMFQRTWQRPPTREELSGLVEDYIKEEVFYREALKMGLDRDDTLIRRRLRQKLEFLAEDFADAVEPTEEELQQFLDEHPDSFRIEGRVTFSQIFLNPERRGDALADDAAELLRKLRADDSVNPVELGDRTLLPCYHESLREREIANQFGPEFASQVRELTPGPWRGPIESAYGVHLVRVHARTAGRRPDLAEVRDQVQREWRAARRAQSKEEFFEQLLQKYRVTVEEQEIAERESAPPE